MSIVFTADVFCDGDLEDGTLCGLWTNGVTGATPPRKAEARERASVEGWRRIGTKDYCPRCVAGLHSGMGDME